MPVPLLEKLGIKNTRYSRRIDRSLLAEINDSTRTQMVRDLFLDSQDKKTQDESTDESIDGLNKLFLIFVRYLGKHAIKIEMSVDGNVKELESSDDVPDGKELASIEWVQFSYDLAPEGRLDEGLLARLILEGIIGSDTDLTHKLLEIS